MKANGVDNNHRKDSTEDFLFSHDQVEPRVQDYSLTGDHAVPANGDDGYRNVVVEGLLAGNQLEELEEESEGVQYTAITRNQQRPEIEASMSFEGKEDLDIEFGDIVPCDCSESSYGHINAFVEPYCSPRYSFGNSLGDTHFGGTEARKLLASECGG